MHSCSTDVQDGNLFVLFVYLCNQHGVTPTMINSLPAKVAQTSVPDSLGQYFQGLTTVMMMSGVFPEAMKDAAHCEYGMTAAVLNYVCMTADVLNYVCMHCAVIHSSYCAQSECAQNNNALRCHT